MESHSSYIKYLAFITLAFTLPAIVLSFYYEPLSGDLTRLGFLSENQYGWKKKQPEQKIFPNPTSTAPEILVIGDSFSYGNVWQSHLKEKYGKDFLTVRWRDFKNQPTCYISSLKRAYPSIKFILFQSVEMGALGHFIETARLLKNKCLDSSHRPILKQPKVQQTETQRTKNGLIKDPIFLYRTFWNDLKTLKEVNLTSKTYVLKLNKNNLFTHKKSNFGLFYRNAINDKKGWQRTDINRAINSAKFIGHHLKSDNLKISFLVIPDKSSAYKDHIKTKNLVPESQLWNRIKREKIFLSLIDEFKQLVNEEADFYLSNDTHLSTQGYKHLAEIIFKKSVLRGLDTKNTES